MIKLIRKSILFFVFTLCAVIFTLSGCIQTQDANKADTHEKAAESSQIIDLPSLLCTRADSDVTNQTVIDALQELYKRDEVRGYGVMLVDDTDLEFEPYRVPAAWAIKACIRIDNQELSKQDLEAILQKFGIKRIFKNETRLTAVTTYVADTEEPMTLFDDKIPDNLTNKFILYSGSLFETRIASYFEDQGMGMEQYLEDHTALGETYRLDLLRNGPYISFTISASIWSDLFLPFGFSNHDDKTGQAKADIDNLDLLNADFSGSQ